MCKSEYLMSLSMFLLIIGLHFSNVFCSILAVVGLTVGLILLRKDLQKIEQLCLPSNIKKIKGKKRE